MALSMVGVRGVVPLLSYLKEIYRHFKVRSQAQITWGDVGDLRSP